MDQQITDMWNKCLATDDWSSFSRTLQIESEWDELSNELQSDYKDFLEFEEAEWVLNSSIYDDSHIDRWS
jgi:hypothetical protein